MIDINEIASTISNIKKNKNTLDVLIEFEGILDDLHIYAYENWIKGEVIKGPIISKYWVEVYLMYPEKHMPNPIASERLIKHGCYVFFQKEKLTSNVKIKTPDDLVQSPERNTRVPDTSTTNVYVVKIVMPRHLLTDYNVKKISSIADEIDLDDVIDAYDQGLDVDRNARDAEDDQDTNIRESRTRISEGVSFEDLKGLVSSNIMIDLHKPKIGSEEDTVVVAFDVTYEDPAKDLANFIETGSVEHLDVEVAGAPDEDGSWKVFVEFQRDTELFEKIQDMLNSVDQITSRDDGEWTYRAFNVKKEVKFDRENFRRDITDSRYEYRKQYLGK